MMRDLDAQSPQRGLILNLGLESSLCVCQDMWKWMRSCRISEKHDKVEFVNYPTLPSPSNYLRNRKISAKRRMRRCFI